MRKVEDIEEEYGKYKMKSTFVTSAEEFATFIELGIEQANEEIKVILKEMKYNCRNEKISKVSNLILGLFQMEEVEYYSEDNEILEEIFEFVSKYKEYYHRIQALVTEENHQELTKLVDFSCLYYNRHIDYFEEQRDALEYQCKGISYYGKCANNIKEFDEFFNKKMKQLGEDKAVEKQKKMC